VPHSFLKENDMRKLLITTAALAGLASPLPAVAAYVVSIMENDTLNNVEASGSGSLNITGLTFDRFSTDYSFLSPHLPFFTIGGIIAGLTTTNGTQYLGISGPSSFGTFSGTQASSASGDLVGINGDARLIVPRDYVSGTLLTSKATWDDATFSSLGLAPGSYPYTWVVAGGGTDSFTINIGPQSTPVPEAASVLMLLSGLFGLGLVRWRGTATLSQASAEDLRGY
jgi:hypothetical protein